MTEVCIYSDEMYPVFYAVPEKEGFWTFSRKCKWPSDLSFEDYQEAVDLFYIWQNHLETLYHNGTKVEENTAWATTTSPSAIITSSTTTS